MLDVISQIEEVIEEAFTCGVLQSIARVYGTEGTLIGRKHTATVFHERFTRACYRDALFEQFHFDLVTDIVATTETKTPLPSWRASEFLTLLTDVRRNLRIELAQTRFVFRSEHRDVPCSSESLPGRFGVHGSIQQRYELSRES